LAKLLAVQGKLDELRVRADSGDPFAASTLADLLAEQGKLDELRELADSGNSYAASTLAALLTEQGRHDEAAAVLRPAADSGQAAAAGHAFAASVAAEQLAALLAEHGKLDELRELADSGDPFAASTLVELLVEQDKPAEAAAVLRHTTNLGYHTLVAEQLADHGRLDELRELTDSGNPVAAEQLAALLAKHGKLDELRELADSGNPVAAEQLVKLLAEQRRLDELWQEVHAGTTGALDALIAVLGEAGTGAGVGTERLRCWGLNADGGIAQPQ
jgi:hypothetical protein